MPRKKSRRAIKAKRNRQASPAIGPPERWRRHVLEIAEIPALGRHFRNATATPLDEYLHRGYIEDRQFQGGDRFRCDYQLAALMPCVTGDLNRLPSGRGDGGSLTEAHVMARQRYRAAVRAIGKMNTKFAHNVCCFDVGVGDLEAEMKWRKGYGMIRFREALDALADHYRLPPQALPARS